MRGAENKQKKKKTNVLRDGHLNPKFNGTPLPHAIIIWKSPEVWNDVISSGYEPDSQLRCCLCQENKLSPKYFNALCSQGGFKLFTAAQWSLCSAFIVASQSHWSVLNVRAAPCAHSNYLLAFVHNRPTSGSGGAPSVFMCCYVG